MRLRGVRGDKLSFTVYTRYTQVLQITFGLKRMGSEFVLIRVSNALGIVGE